MLNNKIIHVHKNLRYNLKYNLGIRSINFCLLKIFINVNKIYYEWFLL